MPEFQFDHLQKLNICFTDIRPGFVATDLLNDGKHYPMLMKADKVGRYIARALKRKRRIVIIDWRYRILVFFWRMIPRQLWKRLPINSELSNLPLSSHVQYVVSSSYIVEPCKDKESSRSFLIYVFFDLCQ